jgi:hypothetical protein
MTISTARENAERPLGLWREQLDQYTPTSLVGRAGQHYDQLAKIGLRLHNQFRAQISAKAAGKEALIPEVQVRISLARQEQKRVAELGTAIDARSRASCTASDCKSSNLSITAKHPRRPKRSRAASNCARCYAQ